MAQLLQEETILVDIHSTESRKKLALMIVRLFKLWELPTQDQLNLLGLSSSSRAMLSKYSKGEPLSSSRDMLDRVGWLLGIHKALRLLFPHNPELRSSWVKRKNKAFDNLTPLEVMLDEGLIGLAKVCRYLDMYRGK